jgi:hypothetical protein
VKEKIWPIVSSVLIALLLGSWGWILFTFDAAVAQVAKTVYTSSGVPVEDIIAINTVLTALQGQVQGEVQLNQEFRVETRKLLTESRDDIKEVYEFLLNNP